MHDQAGIPEFHACGNGPPQKPNSQRCSAIGSRSIVNEPAPSINFLTVSTGEANEKPYDATSLSAGGVLARLNLSVEECQSLVNDAAEDVRALERVLRS